MDDVARLLAVEEIKALKARYFRCVDTKDWEGYAAVFAPDAEFDVSADVPGCVLHGPEQILKVARPPLEQCVSVHHGHCPEIHVMSDTAATGIWAMEDILRWEEGGTSPIRALHGYGHYIETYRRIEGAWRIHTMKLTRLRVDITPWEDGG